MQTLISIVVPVFRVEKYIKACIESILNQRRPEVEVILVDDGSDDECPQICDEYAQKYECIRVIHQRNSGVSVARYCGIQNARGKYIACIDSDDFVSSDYLNEIILVANQYAPDIIYFGSYLMKGETCLSQNITGKTGYYTKNEIEKYIFPELIQNEKGKYFSPNLWSKVFKKELIIQNMLVDSNATVGEDGATSISCILRAQSLYVLNKNLYYYRINQNSATSKRKVHSFEWPVIVNQHIEESVKSNSKDMSEQIWRKIAHDFFNVAVSQFYQKQSYKSIKKHILEMMDYAFFNDAINKCQFSGSLQAKIMELCLKKRSVLFMWVYSKLKLFL